MESEQLTQRKKKRTQKNLSEPESWKTEKINKLYTLYHKKKKTAITINPYKKLVPSMVTFFMIQSEMVRLPDKMI
jgi:hypothetical protein